MRPVHTATCIAAGLAASWCVVAQGLPSKKVLTLEVAQTLAREALASCRASGYIVSVLVVDDADRPMFFMRDDGASNATMELVHLKATSVLKLGRPSGPPPNLAAGAPVPPPVLPGTVNVQGGVPIRVDNQMIGALAVSGAPGGEKDAACANAALAKAAAQLH
jgi:uncharacterized protein GlcG (DUF336 family)